MSRAQELNVTYVIVETRYHDRSFERREVRALAKSPNGRAVVFASQDEALEHIEFYCKSPQRWSGDIKWDPTFEVQEVSRLPQYLSWQL